MADDDLRSQLESILEVGTEDTPRYMAPAQENHARYGGTQRSASIAGDTAPKPSSTFHIRSWIPLAILVATIVLLFIVSRGRDGYKYRSSMLPTEMERHGSSSTSRDDEVDDPLFQPFDL